MSRIPEDLVGRSEGITCFTNELLDPAGQKWIMLVDGLPGTGKRTLANWLRANRCNALPTSMLQLSPYSQPDQLLVDLVEQLDADLGAGFRQGLRSLAAQERQQPLIETYHAPTQNIRAGFFGKVANVDQSLEAPPILGELAPMIVQERRIVRLDLATDSLAPFRDALFVLFVTDAEHLDNPALKQFLIGELVPRLHARFPGFRLFIAGQTVPDNFNADECISYTTEPFSRAEVAEFVSKSSSQVNAQHAYDVTAGHPMLVRLYVEGQNGSSRANTSSHGGMFTETARTKWIYERVLRSIPDKRLREAAANLSLFDWFDLPFLREVFTGEIDEEAFADLLRRSFIRQLPTGRWSCHEVIRKHLVPHRIQLDPERTQTLQRAAFAVYKRRLNTEVERTQETWFDNRLEYSVAAARSATAFSAQSAEDFVLEELALALVDNDDGDGYAYAFTSGLLRGEVPAVIKKLADEVRDLLRALAVMHWNAVATTLLQKLAAAAERLNRHDAAADLLAFGALASWSTNSDLALDLARRAVILEDSLPRRLVAPKLLIFSGKYEEAELVLTEIRDHFGEGAEIQVVAGDLAHYQGNLERAALLYTKAIIDFPNSSSQARLRLAGILLKRGDYEGALREAEAALALDPLLHDAELIRLDALAQLNRFSEMSKHLWQMGAQLPKILEEWYRASAALADAQTRGRLLAELRVDPLALPPVIVFLLCDVIAREGDVAGVEELTASIEARYPETRVLCELKRASALLSTGEFNAAIAKAAPIVAARSESWDAYMILAAARIRLGQTDEALSTLNEMAKRWPTLQDYADQLTMLALNAAGRQTDAAKAVASWQAHRSVGPLARLEYAKVLLSISPDNRHEAEAILDLLIHTEDRSELPLNAAIDARLIYAHLKATPDPAAASAMAASLEKEFGQIPDALIAATVVFKTLRDEENLRRMWTEHGDAPAMVRAEILGSLSQLILAGEPSVDDLMKALQTRPTLELVAALSTLIQIQPSHTIPELYAQVQRLAPEQMRVFNDLGEEVIARSSPAMADQMRQMAGQMGEGVFARLGSAKLFAIRGKMSLKDAQEELHKLAITHPAHATRCVAVEAEILLELGRFDEAAKILEPYIGNAAAPEEILPAISLLHYKRDDKAALITFFQSMAARFPEKRRWALEQVVDLFTASKKTDQALALLEELEREATLEFGLLISRADALFELTRLEDSLAVLQSADPLATTAEQRSLAAQRRARSLREMSRLEDAEIASKEAIKHNPRNASAYFGLAKIYRLQKKPSEAYDAMLTGVAIRPAALSDYENELRDLRAESRPPAMTTAGP